MLERSRWNAARFLCLALFVAVSGCSSHSRPAAAPKDGPGSAQDRAEPSRSVRGHVEAGDRFLERGLLDDAEREYRLALRTDPNDRGGLAGLGQVELKRGRAADAIAHLERATHVSSQMVSAFRSLGDAYVAMGDWNRAATAYRQAVALSPGDVGMRLSLAQALTETGELAEARDVSVGTIRGARGNPALMAQAYRQLGDAHSRDGKVPEAMSALYKASELNPRDPEIARTLAMSAVRGGLYAEAAAAYSRILTLLPLDVGAKKQLAWVNFKLERYPLSIKHYEAVGESLGTVDRYYLAQSYAKSNRVDRAVELFRDVVRIDPENYRGVYCNMAYAYYDANRYQRAIDVAREGLNGDSSSACLKFCWAQALDKLGRHEDAIPVFETVLGDPAYAESAKRELERQRRIVRLLKSKERGIN